MARATLVVTVNIDPIEGSMDDERVAHDVQRILDNAISHYFPVVLRVDTIDQYTRTIVLEP